MGDNRDSQQGRWVVTCGSVDLVKPNDLSFSNCVAPPTHLLTYKSLDVELPRIVLVCDRHAERHMEYLPDTEPVLRPLCLDRARTVPVRAVMPGTCVLDIEDEEWQKAEAWRWIVRSVVRPRRGQPGYPHMRWTYADGRLAEFSRNELVIGWFTSPAM